MSKSTFVYTTYIRTTPKKLWQMLLSAEFQRQYWDGAHFETDWKKGSEWSLNDEKGEPYDEGTIVEIKPMKRLVLRWQHVKFKEMREGFTRCTIELKPSGTAVKLTVTHEINKPKSKFIDAVGGGWPFILSNLKSMLETGKVALKNMG